MIQGNPVQTPILIAGPTASGKSALALRLADALSGSIVNTDALQVYGCWRILTARPDSAEIARAPHFLYGHVGCTRRYSTGDWLRDLAPALAAIRSAGRRAILVGGTGLYFGAATRGLAEIPPIPHQVRQASDMRLADGGIEALVADLEVSAPGSLAGMDTRNPRRVQRAWEVWKSTGQGLDTWQQARTEPILPDAVRLVLEADTTTLNHRIKLRLMHMIEAGALDEVAGNRHVIETAGPAAKALGARAFLDHVDGKASLEAAMDSASAATRRYAKRQRTWFRNQMADWPRLDADAPDLVARALELVTSG